LTETLEEMREYGHWLDKVEVQMKRITIDYILSREPCYNKEQLEAMFKGRKYVLPKTVIKEAKPEDVIWLLTHVDFIPKKELRLLACDYAEHVLHIFEEKCPKDDLPRKAIETARAYTNGEATRKEMAAARAAARAAAGAAAWDAERKWQLKRLAEYLGGYK